MRIRTLASLASHVAIEVGDRLHPPGFPEGIYMGPGEFGVRMQVTDEKGRVGYYSTSEDGVGLVYMDQEYLRPRGSGAFDHINITGQP